MPTKSLETLEEMIGWESPAFTVELENGRIEDFATAIHDDDPVFTDSIEAQSRGVSGCPVPVTFFGAIFYLDRDIHEPDLGFRTEDKLHGEQKFDIEQVPTAGETLSGKTTLIDVTQRDHGDGTLTKAILQTEYRNEEGDLVVTGTKKLLEVTDQ
jgi:hypothetical protein